MVVLTGLALFSAIAYLFIAILKRETLHLKLLSGDTGFVLSEMRSTSPPRKKRAKFAGRVLTLGEWRLR